VIQVTDVIQVTERKKEKEKKLSLKKTNENLCSYCQESQETFVLRSSGAGASRR
jgi:hypothetical protein